MPQLNIKQIKGDTQGSILFLGNNGVVSENNSKLYWDNTNHRLNIGTSSLSTSLYIYTNNSIDAFRVSVGTTNSLYINSKGSIGINTTNPNDNSVGGNNTFVKLTYSGNYSYSNILQIDGPFNNSIPGGHVAYFRRNLDNAGTTASILTLEHTNRSGGSPGASTFRTISGYSGSLSQFQALSSGLFSMGATYSSGYSLLTLNRDDSTMYVPNNDVSYILRIIDSSSVISMNQGKYGLYIYFSGTYSPSNNNKLYGLYTDVSYVGSTASIYSGVFIGGNFGINTSTPSNKFHLYSTQSGAFRLQDTTEGAGKILISDSNGVGTWTASSNVFNGPTGSGTGSYMTRWVTSTQIGSSNIWHNSGGTAIGIGTSSVNNQLFLQFNSNYNDGIGIKNISNGNGASSLFSSSNEVTNSYLLMGVLGGGNTLSSTIGGSNDSIIRQGQGGGDFNIGKMGGVSAIGTSSYHFRILHGNLSGLTTSSVFNITKATFSSTYYHYGIGPKAANYGESGYITFGTGSNQARFRHGEVSISSANFELGSAGAAVSSIMTGVAETSGAVNSYICLDTSSGVEKIYVPDKSVIGYRIHVVGTDTTSGGASRGVHISHVGTIRRPSGGNVVLDSDTKTSHYNGYTGADTLISADTSNNTLSIRVDGAASYDIRWVARIDIVQVIING